MRAAGLPVLTLLVGAGCYGDPVRYFLPGHGDAGPDAPDAWLYEYPDAPDAGPEPDAFECNTLATSALDVSVINEPGTAPAPFGGSLPNATYRLESVHLYGGVTFPAAKFTWRFTSGQFDMASRTAGETVDTLRSGTYTLDSTANTIQVSVTCGATNGNGGYGYSVLTATGELDMLYGGAVLFHYVPVP